MVPYLRDASRVVQIMQYRIMQYIVTYMACYCTELRYMPLYCIMLATVLPSTILHYLYYMYCMALSHGTVPHYL